MSRPRNGTVSGGERSLKDGPDFEWILEHDIDRLVRIKYDYEWLLFTI